jgi:hypothetical protein
MLLTGDYQTLRRLASVARIMYHGTDAENLPSIMSQGLIPNPKKKVWQEDPHAGFYVPSRVSLPGVYLTENFGTASASGGKGKTRQTVIVAVQVQTGSLLMDEDDPGFAMDRSLPSHDYSVASMYASWQAMKLGRIKSEEQTQHIVEYLVKAREKFMEDCLSSITRNLKGELTSQEMQRAREILEPAFYVALTRKASYYNDDYYWGSDRFYNISKPDSGKAEADFRKVSNQLTRSLKRLARPEHLSDRAFSPKGRVETPIRFTGKNKIVAIVQEVWTEEDGKTVVHAKIHYPPSKKVPEQLIQGWKKTIGSWDPI